MEPELEILENIHFRCLNVDYSLLVVSNNDALRLYGSFAFQVLFGLVEINGYLFPPKHYNSKNFISVSVPVMNVPLFIQIISDLPQESAHSVLTNRLRELVDQPAQIASNILTRSPSSVVILIKNEQDFASKFIAQQYSQSIFKAPLKSVYTEIDRCCYLLSNSQQTFNGFKEQTYVYTEAENLCIQKILKRISNDSIQNRNVKEGCGRIFIVGNKGVGKSTLMRYLINVYLSKKTFEQLTPKQIFLLDCDVGQSELTPPGLISLHEITQPFFSASFSNQVLSLKRSFFFGSNSPGVDFELYKHLVRKCLAMYEELATPYSILFVNTVGWIEDLGYDLMCSLLHEIEPTLLINVQVDGILSFEVPSNYRSITSVLKRKETNSDVVLSHKKPSSVLRNFLVAGYLANCFNVRQPVSSGELRLADCLAYRLRFKSIAVYFHPELSYVVDRLIFSALNCAVVALCYVDLDDEENAKCFERHRICATDSLPERLTLQKGENNEPMLPVLHCYGYGMIRSIDLERKVFYLITPVDKSLLTTVNVFALGHELQSSAILFDSKGLESAPYLVEFGKAVSRNHQKLFSPLRNITSMKRGLANSDKRSRSQSTKLRKMTLKKQAGASMRIRRF